MNMEKFPKVDYPKTSLALPMYLIYLEITEMTFFSNLTYVHIYESGGLRHRLNLFRTLARRIPVAHLDFFFNP